MNARVPSAFVYCVWSSSVSHVSAPWSVTPHTPSGMFTVILLEARVVVTHAPVKSTSSTVQGVQSATPSSLN